MNGHRILNAGATNDGGKSAKPLAMKSSNGAALSLVLSVN
jgi:hypothetical protein